MSANELLQAFVSVDGPPAGGGKTTVTKVTGGGLTWQLVARSNAQLGGAEIWRAFAPGILTNVAVTATLSRSFSSSMTVAGRFCIASNPWAMLCFSSELTGR